jgi:hypothetical protein
MNKAVRLHQQACSHLWILPNIGKSSLRCGSAITLGDETLATASRVFARRRTTGGAAWFSDQERERFLHNFVLDDEHGNVDLRFDLNTHPLPTVERWDTNSDIVSMAEPVLSVKIGPQHVNFGNHADHAFLAETAAHALALGGHEAKNSESPKTLRVQYISEGMIDQMLHCHLHGDGKYVAIFGEEMENEGKQKLVLSASTDTKGFQPP